jgi:hypothetical protein
MAAMSSSVLGRRAAPASRTARLPWALLAATVVLAVAQVPLSLGHEPLFDTITYGLLALAFGVTGALVASRQPTNAIGWIFCASGVWGGANELWEAIAYHRWPTGVAGQWVISWSWIWSLAAYTVVFLLFPGGRRLMSPRWRRVIWLLAVGCALAIPGQALSPDNKEFVDGRNPLAVKGVVVQIALNVGITMALASFVISVAGIVIRYRQAVGIERLQLKQFVFAGSVLIPIMAVAMLFYDESAVVRIAIGLALTALPVAVGLAILRYRLYDIDVVINRTLVYGSLTATLAGAYLGSVLVLQLALSTFTEGSALAVAVSTLAVAALFRPVRGRIQGAVDRRFFRRKYDAARTLEAFGVRLRDEVDLVTLNAELRAVVADTMQPAHVSLWLRGPEAGQ